MAKKKIAIVGAGAVGCYAGAHMVQAGEDVTFIDPGRRMSRRSGATGLRDHPYPRRRAVHRQAARAAPDRGAAARQGGADRHRLRLHEILRHRLGDGDDQAIPRARRLCRLAAELHERGDHRRHRRLGQDIGLDRQLDHRRAARARPCAPGRRQIGPRHTVFRVGEVHGRITDRAEEVCQLVGYADSAMVTENLWGERWSKLVTNVMGNGLSACTGMISRDMLKNDAIRHFSNRLGSEAIRVGQALGYTFDEVSHMDPETFARAGEGDPAAQKEIDDHRLAEANRPAAASTARRWARTWSRDGAPRSSSSTALSCARARRSAFAAPTNAVLTDIVTRVETRRVEARPEAHHRSAAELRWSRPDPHPASGSGLVPPLPRCGERVRGSSPSPARGRGCRAQRGG